LFRLLNRIYPGRAELPQGQPCVSPGPGLSKQDRERIISPESRNSQCKPWCNSCFCL